MSANSEKPTPSEPENLESVSESLDIREILELLPHRYPFLMIDRVKSISGKKISAIKNVTINEPFFNGHFPGKPVMPGVLQLEAMAQAAGILFFRIINDKAKLALFMSADRVKFRKMVVPGDQLVIDVEMLRTRGGKMGVAAATCSVDGVVVSSAELTFAISEFH